MLLRDPITLQNAFVRLEPLPRLGRVGLHQFARPRRQVFGNLDLRAHDDVAGADIL